eukprot:jgi/Mesen1/8612/ME000050S08027
MTHMFLIVGWYTRIVDHDSGSSYAAIVGSISSSQESVVVVLACHAQTHGQVLLQNVSITQSGHPVDSDPDVNAPPNFEWSAPGHGYLSVQPHETRLDLSLGGLTLRANLSSQKLWRAGDYSATPEGWLARLLPHKSLLPTRWAVYSVRSEATYSYVSTSETGEQQLQGTGWGHEEKNWGRAFPAGHIWGQAISADGSYQVVIAVAYFRAAQFRMPSVYAMGYRSAALDLDFRNIDPGVWFSDLTVDACVGKFSFTAHNPTYSVSVKFSGPPSTFSAPILGPTASGTWVGCCSESFVAVAEIEVLKHGMWARMWGSVSSAMGTEGVQGTQIDNVVIGNAAMEFGEEYMCSKPQDLPSH